MKDLSHQQSTMQQDLPQLHPSELISRKKKRYHPDRFIPNRSTTHDSQLSFQFSPDQTQQYSYHQLIAENLVKKRDCDRVLNYSGMTKPTQTLDQSVYEMISRKTQSEDRTSQRSISLAPEKILDAPQLLDDYYLNLMDWSSCGPLAIGLNNKVYLYTPRQISQLCNLDQSYVCSVSFHSHNPLLAVGTSQGRIHLYDLQRQTLLRVMRGHFNRVSSLSFSSLLFSGSKDTSILGHDIKSPNNVSMRFDGHKGEVCGLKHDPCGLASGSNDNTAIIWDINAGRDRHTLLGHKAAVKAMGWCPWQRGLLATGGGTTDKTMKFWNTDTGKLVNSVNTHSQVCSLIWNRNQKEILSSHGFSHNQLCIWKYPSATKVVELHGHTQRVLHMALSPDGSTVCSASPDQTLRFWRVFDGQMGSNFEKKQSNYLNPGLCSLR